MNLRKVSDKELLTNTKQLVVKEREHLTLVLHHLREVERRKLYSDLRYSSLFDYAVRELKYSEGQAGRRIQAMRLIAELPEIEEKIKSGALNLTHVSMAQSYFRAADKASPHKLAKETKIDLLKSFENITSRDAERILLRVHPAFALPREGERIVDEFHNEVKFLIDREFQSLLSELKALLGVKAIGLNLSDLFRYTVNITLREQRIKKFGKRNADQKYYVTGKPVLTTSSSTPAPELGAEQKAFEF